MSFEYVLVHWIGIFATILLLIVIILGLLYYLTVVIINGFWFNCAAFRIGVYAWLKSKKGASVSGKEVIMKNGDVWIKQNKEVKK